MAIVASGQISLVDLNDSKQLQAYIGSSQPKTQIYDPTASTYTPNWTSTKPVLTPQLFIAGSATDLIASADPNIKSITWNVDGTDITASTANYTLASSGVKTLTINTNTLSSANSTLIKCTIIYTDPATSFDITTVATFDFVKVQNGAKGNTGSSGANAITIFLSNSSVTLPATNAGVVSNFASSATDLFVYDGTTPLSFLTSGTAGNSQFTVTASISPASGVTLATPTAGTSPNRATYGNITAMSSSSDVVTVTYTVSGKNSAGTAISGSVTQTFSKSKMGADGTTPTVYSMTATASAIQKSASGVLNPASFTSSGFSQTGSGSITAYSGYWNVYSTTSAVTSATSWGTATRVPASGTATTGTITVPSNSLGIKVDFLTSGGTVVDSQIIPVVSDGAKGNDGTSAVIASVWTPNGSVIKNGSVTSLIVECDVYNGSTQVPTSGTGSPTYKWYIQDPSATTASGGDSDGGNGWRLLSATYTAGTLNYTTYQLTVPASAIVSVESFKCVATLGTSKPSDVCTLTDTTDPISVVIVGGSTFKNGQGSTSLTAKLYQNGTEIDTQGSGYTYTWYLYNSDGTEDTTWNTTGSMTGKTITVQATDVTGQANLICQIS